MVELQGRIYLLVIPGQEKKRKKLKARGLKASEKTNNVPVMCCPIVLYV